MLHNNERLGPHECQAELRAFAHKKAAMNELLRWILAWGQKESASLGYVPLSRDAVMPQMRLLNAHP